MSEKTASPPRAPARSRGRGRAAARDGEVGDGVEPMWDGVDARALLLLLTGGAVVVSVPGTRSGVFGLHFGSVGFHTD